MVNEKYSYEEVEWLKAEYPNHTVKELLDLFCKKFRCISNSAIRSKLCKLGLNSKNPYKVLTKEQEIWIVENHGSYSIKELAAMFEEKFDRKCNARNMVAMCTLRGLRKKAECHTYDDEQERFFQEHYSIMRTDDFVKAFNERFDLDFPKSRLTDKANNLGLSADAEKEYQNQMLKKRQVDKSIPIGGERLDKSRNMILVKIDDKPCGGGCNWKPKKDIVWKERHGEIPKGMNVICIDGDKTNFDDNNLMLVSDYVFHKYLIWHRCHHCDDREIKRTYLMMWQLQEKIANKKKVR